MKGSHETGNETVGETFSRVNLKFLLINDMNDSDVPYPFADKNIFNFTGDEKMGGIILYLTLDDIDDSILNEKYTYVFFREIKDISLNISKYTLSKHGEGFNYQKNLFVLFGTNDDENEIFDNFLTNNFYNLDEDIEDEEEEIDCRFNRFKKQSSKLSLSSYENYLAEMLKSIGYDQTVYHHVKKYMGYFNVALTAPDVCPNEDENYERSEFLGDQVAWKVMDEIFEEHCKKNNIKLVSSSFITSLHRSFSSKIIQARLAKELNLHNFLKTEKEITVDVREDIFESFTGVLYYVNFLIKSNLGIDYKLDENFLKWVYESISFTNFEEKPEITKFYENVKMVVGPFKFKEKKTQRGSRIMKFNPHVEEQFLNSLKTDFVDEPKFKIKYTESELGKIVFDLFGMLRKTYATNTENLNEERTKKFSPINNYMQEKLTEEFFLRKKQERNISSWTDDEKEQFYYLIKEYNLQNLMIDKRFIDKSATDYYWVLFDPITKEEVYDTLNYSDSENPETLFSLIRSQKNNLENINVDNVKIENFPKNYKGDYLVKKSTNEKFVLNGNNKDIEEYLKNIMAKTSENNFVPDWEYFIRTESDYDDIKEKYFSYSPYHEIKFDKNFNIDFIRQKLKNRNSTEYPRHIYRFFGDRLAYGQVCLLAMGRYKIRDEHNLTIIKNFFRSKSFKDEITKVINIHENDDPGQPLIHYDELLGMNRETAHLVIQRVHSDITFPHSILDKPEVKLQKLLKNILYAKRDPRRKEKVGLFLEKENKTYTYFDSFGKTIKVKINHHNYLQVSYYFSKLLIQHEKELNPRWNEIQNAKFSINKYGILENTLQRLGVNEWIMDREEKNGRKYITIRFEKNDNLRFYKGTDVESIMKQFDFI